MSSNIETATRRSALLLATSILALSGSLASAQTPPTALPPVEVSPPTDPNKTRARPLESDGSQLEKGGAKDAEIRKRQKGAEWNLTPSRGRYEEQ